MKEEIKREDLAPFQYFYLSIEKIRLEIQKRIVAILASKRRISWVIFILGRVPVALGDKADADG